MKVYFGAGDQTFAPKSVYCLQGLATDGGWQYWVALHNHTVRTLNRRVALGVRAPNTNEVQLFRGLVQTLSLREVWVTNGIYTGVVCSENLGRFLPRD